MSYEFKVPCFKVKNKSVITCQGHKTFSITGQVGDLQEKEVHGVIIGNPVPLIGSDHPVHIGDIFAQKGDCLPP